MQASFSSLCAGLGIEEAEWVGPTEKEETESSRSGAIPPKRRHLVSTNVQKLFVGMYWDTVDLEDKKKVLTLRTRDLMKHFASCDNRRISKIFCEAITFAKEHHAWKFSDLSMNLLQPYIIDIDMWPTEPSKSWVEMLKEKDWRPVDTSAAVKMLESHQSIKEGDPVVPFDRNWPVSGDKARANILSRIKNFLNLLLDHNHLPKRVLKVLIKYSLKKLHNSIPKLEPLIQGVEQTPLCLRFLEVPQLQYVIRCLSDLLSLVKPEFQTANACCDIKSRIGFTDESTFLLLDKHFTWEEFNFFAYQETKTIIDDTSSTDYNEDGVLPFPKCLIALLFHGHERQLASPPDAKCLIAWLFDGPSNEQQLASWEGALEWKKQKSIEAMRDIEKIMAEYKNLSEIKREYLRQKKAAEAVEDILIKESNNKKESPEFAYEVLLKKRQDEVGGKTDALETFILKVLKQKQIGQDSLVEAFQEQIETLSLKLCKIETCLMHCIAVKGNLQSKLQKLSVMDYRFILWVFLASYLRDQWVDPATKYLGEWYEAIDYLLQTAQSKPSRDAKDPKATGGDDHVPSLQSESPNESRCRPCTGLPEGRFSSYDERQLQSKIREHQTSSAASLTGSRKNLDQYHCFLDMIRMSLWHLRCFRFELQGRRDMHVCVGNTCVICSLSNTFTVFSNLTNSWSRDVVFFHYVEKTLGECRRYLHRDTSKFEEHTIDAIRILAGTFEGLLQESFCVPGEENKGENNRDCSANERLLHPVIGSRRGEAIHCCYCSSVSTGDKASFTWFIRMVDELTLRKMKEIYMDCNLDMLMMLAHRCALYPCELEERGFGGFSSVRDLLTYPPEVFVTVIARKPGSRSVTSTDNSTTLAALSRKVDLGVLCGCGNSLTEYALVALVCVSGKNYKCFGYRPEFQKYYVLDDEGFKVVGGWDDVITFCTVRTLQPLILFFENESSYLGGM